MNDNQQLQGRSLIEMLADDKKITVMHSREIISEFIEMAAMLIRANKDLRFIELQDLNGGQILAYRGEHPQPGEIVTL